MNQYTFNSALSAILILFILGFLFLKCLVDYLKRQNALKAEQDGEEKKGYVKTTGHFTGKSREIPAALGRGYVIDSRMEYEIEYLVDDKAYTAWHTFYPAEPPDDEGALAGVRVAVSYDEKKPWIFILDEIFWDIV